MRPERGGLRQRLGLEHVERRGFEGAIVEAGKNIRLNLRPATSRIDEDGSAETSVMSELLEQAAVVDTARLGRQRQQADQNVRAREKSIQFICAGEYLKAFDVLRRARTGRCSSS
jgi:hypothetical protein